MISQFNIKFKVNIFMNVYILGHVTTKFLNKCLPYLF